MSAANPADVADLAAARARVLDRIAAAAARAGRNPAGVRVVAVSKTVSADRVRAAIEAGLDTLGENRVQEAEAKKPLASGGHWHLIGPLQSNKARRAIETFDVVESVDSLELARRLGRLASEVYPGRALPIFIQVNVDDDASKAGFGPRDLERDLAEVLGVAGLRVDGLMTIGRLVERAEDARPTFVALRKLGERLRALDARLGPELSMGMSDDYPIAVEEGATVVRIGRAIFGARTP